MPADKDSGSEALDKRLCVKVIMSGGSAYVGHQHTHSPAFEMLERRIQTPGRTSVAVAVNSDNRLERTDSAAEILVATPIAGVPDAVNRREEAFEFGIKDPVSVAYQPYIHSEKVTKA